MKFSEFLKTLGEIFRAVDFPSTQMEPRLEGAVSAPLESIPPSPFVNAAQEFIDQHPELLRRLAQ